MLERSVRFAGGRLGSQRCLTTSCCKRCASFYSSLSKQPPDDGILQLFHQKPKGVHPNQVARQESPPRLPPKEELAVLIEACQKAGAGVGHLQLARLTLDADCAGQQRGTLSFHPERPFLNIVHLIEKVGLRRVPVPSLCSSRISFAVPMDGIELLEP